MNKKASNMTKIHPKPEDDAAQIKEKQVGFTSKYFWYARAKELLILTIVFSAFSAYLQRDMIDGKAPQLSATGILGETLNLIDTEQPTLVYFWGSWCGYCKVTSPMVHAVAQDYRVISLAVESGSDAEIKQYMLQHDIDFPTINDTQRIHKKWGVRAFPSIYIIDKAGDIKFVTTGLSSSWGLKLRMWLTEF